jgi:hypothetical protein
MEVQLTSYFLRYEQQKKVNRREVFSSKLYEYVSGRRDTQLIRGTAV